MPPRLIRDSLKTAQQLNAALNNDREDFHSPLGTSGLSGQGSGEFPSLTAYLYGSTSQHPNSLPRPESFSRSNSGSYPTQNAEELLQRQESGAVPSLTAYLYGSTSQHPNLLQRQGSAGSGSIGSELLSLTNSSQSLGGFSGSGGNSLATSAQIETWNKIIGASIAKTQKAQQDSLDIRLFANGIIPDTKTLGVLLKNGFKKDNYAIKIIETKVKTNIEAMEEQIENSLDLDGANQALSFMRGLVHILPVIVTKVIEAGCNMLPRTNSAQVVKLIQSRFTDNPPTREKFLEKLTILLADKGLQEITCPKKQQAFSKAEIWEMLKDIYTKEHYDNKRRIVADVSLSAATIFRELHIADKQLAATTITDQNVGEAFHSPRKGFSLKAFYEYIATEDKNASEFLSKLATPIREPVARIFACFLFQSVHEGFDVSPDAQRMLSSSSLGYTSSHNQYDVTHDYARQQSPEQLDYIISPLSYQPPANSITSIIPEETRVALSGHVDDRIASDFLKVLDDVFS